MKQPLNVNSDIVPYNKTVQKAYFTILKEVKAMLANIEHEELRYTLIREDKPRTVVGHVIYEIVNPLIYLRLEEHTDGIYSIHFGIEPVERLGQLTDITTRFLRLLYKVTMLGAFPVDIESCVRTDWFVHNVSGLYEYLEESEKYTFKLIPYKVTASKQRQMKAVA